MDGGRDYIQLEGTVASIIYQNPENGYAVLRFEAEGGVVTATGCLPGIAPGESLRLLGAWETHASYGEQFRAEVFERRMPSGAEAIYRYLASGVVKGLGPAKARDIVDKFGDDTLKVIEGEPEKLASVRGITHKGAVEIGIWFRRQAGLRHLIEFLSGYAVKPAVAMRLYKYYGDEALAAVQDNPFIIVGDDIGAAFSEADEIALDLGFESDCEQRVCAAILFEMTHNLQNGHTFIPREKLIGATNQLIDIGYDTASDALDVLCDTGDVVIETVAGLAACYLDYMYDAEHSVAARISDMAQYKVDVPRNIARLITEAETAQGITYADM